MSRYALCFQFAGQGHSFTCQTVATTKPTVVDVFKNMATTSRFSFVEELDAVPTHIVREVVLNRENLDNCSPLSMPSIFSSQYEQHKSLEIIEKLRRGTFGHSQGGMNALASSAFVCHGNLWYVT